MDRVLYIFGRMVIALLQAMPLCWVARLGRCGGEVVFWLDGRHRKVALRNLTLCFQGAKSPGEIRALAHENFRRIGENYACSVKTSGMSERQLKRVMEVEVNGEGKARMDGSGGRRGNEETSNAERRTPNAEQEELKDIKGIKDADCGGRREGCLIYATGHFGNFELFSRLSSFIGGYTLAATYRGLRPAWLDRLVLGLRSASGAGVMYERRTEADALKRAMSEGGRLLILFSDQSARENGVELPFLGRPCWTSRAPAIMAMRYKGALFVPICYRTGLGRWRIEVGAPIPTHEGGRRRSIEAVTRDMNSALEEAVKRDPANWFWVHNRWKARGPQMVEG